MVNLRASHEKKDGLWNGVNVFKGEVEDMMKNGVIEPISVKEQEIKSAAESASMIMRIDDVIAGAKSAAPRGMPPGGPPGGMPGMPGGMPGGMPMGM
jgi:chaperonin GroEL (HSP60 family)